WWLAAIAGHLGATFIAYAGIALVYLADRGTAEGVVHAPDYGISAVWAATTGMLLVHLHRGGAHPRVTAACTAGLLGAFVARAGVDGELADVEHLLAFVIGLGAAHRSGLRQEMWLPWRRDLDRRPTAEAASSACPQRT